MTVLQESSVLRSAKEIVEGDEYDYQLIQLEESLFHLFGRKENGIGLSEIERSLRKMWPLLSKYFHKRPKETAIVDLDAPLGGGPLAPSVMGIFFSNHISEEHQILIQQSTGWLPKSSTAGYISQYYSHFPNPAQSYVDDMLVHELGHLFFGWGLTTVDYEKPNDWWFAFGMGLLYDRLAWDQVYTALSPLFSKIVAKWKDDFSKQSDVDQRLINPDMASDKKHGLQRLQTYGHGKAYEFLKALRTCIGASAFDEGMNYFIDSNNRTANYDDFLSIFKEKDRLTVTTVEEEFRIR